VKTRAVRRYESSRENNIGVASAPETPAQWRKWRAGGIIGSGGIGGYHARRIIWHHQNNIYSLNKHGGGAWRRK